MPDDPDTMKSPSGENLTVSAKMSPRRWLTAVVVTTLAAAFVLARGQWPEIFIFAMDPAANPVERLLNAPIHLADDVMISLRSGDFVLRAGLPRFNLADSAQASTSLLTPYIYAFLALFLPGNFAVGLIGVLGFLSVVATFFVIVFFARSQINGTVLVLLLTITSTNLNFALTGWDHLLQGLLMAAALVLVFRSKLRVQELVIVSVLVALATTVRLDGLLIAIAILLTAVIQMGRPSRRQRLALGLPFLSLGLAASLVNWLQFGHLTGTTTRLKAGAAPSAQYIWDYAYRNGVVSFTALTLVVALSAVTLLFSKKLPMKTISPLLIASILTSAIAVVNSDIFPGARMFWTSAVVLSLLLGLLLPGIWVSGPALQRTGSDRSASRVRAGVELSTAAMVLTPVILVSAWSGLRGAIVNTDSISTSRAAQQFVAATWIQENLSPGDGAVGVFFAGNAFHMPNFEVADFLGKADEDIATESVKWGPPGHNKWNIDLTLDKWKPQVILPALDQDPQDPQVWTTSQEWLLKEWDHGYVADLMLNARIREAYVYCRVPAQPDGTSVTADLLLLKDLVSNNADEISCSDPA